MTAAQPALPLALPFARDRVTWLSYVALGYLIFAESSLGPAMPSIRADLDIGYTAASLHFTAVAAGAVGSAWIGDRVARRIGRSKAFWLGSGGMLIGMLLIVASPLLVGTIAGSALLGTSGALMSIVVQACLADRHGRHRAIAMSELNMSASAGAILAAVAVGLLERTPLGWRGAEVAVGAGFVAVAYLLRGADFAGPVPPAAGRRAAGGALPRLFWICCAIGMLSAAAEWGFAYWGADFLHRVVGFSTPSAAIAMSGFFVAMAGGRLFGARLAGRFDPFDLVLGAFCLAAVGFPMFWLAGSPVLALAGLALVGLGIANVYPLVASIATGLTPGRADVAIARLLFTGSVAVLAAPFALGVLGDLVGIELAFGIVAPVLVSATLLSYEMRRDHRAGPVSDGPK